MNIGDLFGSIRGGLGIGVVLVGMLLAASTGIVGATVVTMGMLALPTMLKAVTMKNLQLVRFALWNIRPNNSTFYCINFTC